MKFQRGFTVVELMVVVVILAILVTIAGPSFVRSYQSTIVSSSINSMMSDLRYARSEALRRGTRVVLCRSDNPEVSSPSCASTGLDWSGGWIVFVDADSNNQFSTGDSVLKVQSANARVGAITEVTAATSPTTFSYASTGRAVGLAGTTTVRVGDSSFSAAVQRKLCVNLTGQPRISGDGTSSCT